MDTAVGTIEWEHSVLGDLAHQVENSDSGRHDAATIISFTRKDL